MRTPPNILFNDARLRAKKYKIELIQKISTIIDSGLFFHGTENQKLIKNVGNYLKTGYLTTTASGHDSLLLALNSLQLSAKDEVIFPVNAYPTAFPIAQSGGNPIPVDVDQNGLIDPKQVAKKITENTKVIVIVHLYGLVADVDGIKRLIKNKKIILIEDCAQAFGSTYKGKPVGIFGDMSAFSFYPTKNLATLGDGGALWTKHKKLYEYFKKAVSYGETKRNQSEFVSGHSRLPEIQAGILNVYFKNIKKERGMRRKLFDYYRELIDSKLNKSVRILFENKNSNPALHLLVIEANDRDKLRKHLKKRGIETSIHYPYPIHLLPAFSYLNYKKDDFPTAERLAKNILSLPFHPYLTKKQVQFIVKSIRDFYYG